MRFQQLEYDIYSQRAHHKLAARYPLLDNNESARALGIAPGEMMTIESRRGSINIMARADRAVSPDMVFLPFAYVEAAANIQALFWPGLPELGAGSHVWGLSKPAKFVGGDVYDVIRMPDESWLVYETYISEKI